MKNRKAPWDVITAEEEVFVEEKERHHTESCVKGMLDRLASVQLHKIRYGISISLLYHSAHGVIDGLYCDISLFHMSDLSASMTSR
jgi:hypothetical protein